MRGIVETEKERKDGIRKWEENRGCWNLKENRGVIESWKRVSFSGEEIEGIGNLVGSFCFMGIKGVGGSNGKVLLLVNWRIKKWMNILDKWPQ